MFLRFLIFIYLYIIIGDGQFILAFARRNVPIDKVFEVAEEKGLIYKILETQDLKHNVMEPIYLFTFK